jgi:ABC-type phosphate/phosphonate transport system substrate-binding protein
LLAVRKDLEFKLLRALKETLINMDKDPEGQGVLKRQQNTTKFDEIPPSSLAQLQQIEKFIFNAMRKELDTW